MLWDAKTLSEYGLLPSSTPQKIPDAPQDVASVLDRPLQSRPDAEALIGRHSRLTFAQVDAAVNSAAAFLQDLGLAPGDRIAASAANQVDIVIAFLASQRLGAIWVGINRNYTTAEKGYFINDAGVSMYLADRSVAAELASISPEVASLRRVIEFESDPNSEWAQGLIRHAGASRAPVAVDPHAPAAIAYTSGTTGFPKGAVHSQHNIMVAATMAEQMAGDRREAVTRGTSSQLTILNIMIGGPVATLASGVRQVCMDRIDAAGIVEWVKKENINTLTLVPTLVHDLLTRPDIDQRDLASLTWVVAGSALVPEALPELYQRRFGHKLTIGYGLTENPTAVTRSDRHTAASEGAVGRALAHLRVAILDEENHEVTLGEIGEICVRAADSGPWRGVYTPTLGYWKKPEATQALLRGGWLHTGDLGSIDAAGQVSIRARRSDLIIRGGSNIYPAEIERVLRQDPRIRECAVVAKPDPRLGECPVAFVQPAGAVSIPALIEDLKALCGRVLARYKIPVDWIVLDEFPRNAMGKIIKTRLKELLVEVDR